MPRDGRADFEVKDCSPFPANLKPGDRQWLARLAQAARAGDLLIRLEDGREDEPVVSCAPDGEWWAGRYIGDIVFEGRTLRIKPRFGAHLRAWCAGAFNLVLTQTQGAVQHDDWIVPWLMAAIWTRGLTAAARHGLPALRADVRETGLSIRGRLDVPGTVRQRAAGSPAAVSMRRDKTLDHAISAAIAAAYGKLKRTLRPASDNPWPPRRVKELMSPIIAAAGASPRIPTEAEIEAVRLTPITAGFRSLALLSARIASGRGLTSGVSDHGRCEGVLLDVAELWELYVLAVLRRAWPDAEVAHGTREMEDSRALLRNAHGGELGNLKPDALVRLDGTMAAVVDAKYKRLRAGYGYQTPQREDLYQLAAYIGRYGERGRPMTGALMYPCDPDSAEIAHAERDGPWYLNGDIVHFVTLPHDIDEAADKLRELALLDGQG